MSKEDIIIDYREHRMVYIYQRDYPEIRQKVIDLWRANHILPKGTDPTDRVNQVVLACIDKSDNVVAVTTVYREYRPRLKQQAYMFRLFVQPISRNPYLMRALTRSTYEVLNEVEIANKPPSMIIVTENKKLMRPGLTRAISRINFVKLGVDNENRDVWQRVFTQFPHKNSSELA